MNILAIGIHDRSRIFSNFLIANPIFKKFKNFKSVGLLFKLYKEYFYIFSGEQSFYDYIFRTFANFSKRFNTIKELRNRYLLPLSSQRSGLYN